MSADTIQTCIICKQEFQGWGHNPEPVAAYADGRACNLCNSTVVIPARLTRHYPVTNTTEGDSQ